MGFLLGLPLKLLALVFGLLRVLIPVLLLILVIRWLGLFPPVLKPACARRGRCPKGPRSFSRKTVDYKEVKDDDRHKE